LQNVNIIDMLFPYGDGFVRLAQAAWPTQANPSCRQVEQENLAVTP
jgi:hypothetical protein